MVKKIMLKRYGFIHTAFSNLKKFLDVKRLVIDKILKDIKGIFKVQDKARFVKQNIPYLAFFYVGNIFSHHVRSYTGGDVIDRIFQGILELNTMGFLPSIYLVDILTGIGVAAIIKFIIYTKGKNAKKFRQGREYGSARWVA